MYLSNHFGISSNVEYIVPKAFFLDHSYSLSLSLFLSVPLIAPKNLKVSEEWYNRFRIAWDTPPSPTMGYRVIYQPVSGKHTATSLLAMRDTRCCVIMHIMSVNMNIVWKILLTYSCYWSLFTLTSVLKQFLIHPLFCCITLKSFKNSDLKNFLHTLYICTGCISILLCFDDVNEQRWNRGHFISCYMITNRID